MEQKTICSQDGMGPKNQFQRLVTTTLDWIGF